MKWIGQHIWDLISRFRNYIYVEKTDTSTSTKALVVDPDGKVGTNSNINTDTTYQAGDGIVIDTATTPDTLSVNIFSTGGLFFDGTGKMAVNVGHANVQGVLPITKGGTGQITAQLAINALSSVSGATNEHVLTKDTATGNATFKAVATGHTNSFLQATCTGTALTSATDGSANAVIIPFDTETVQSADALINIGTGTAANCFTLKNSAVYKFDWTVASNTSVVNNRVLGGVKLQRGACEGDSHTWVDVNPTHGYLYNRGNGSIREASCSGSIIINHTVAETNCPIYRLVIWKVAASNAGCKVITEINGTQMNIIKLT